MIDKVKYYCKQQGQTLGTLADKIGISRQTLYNTLTAQNPRPQTIQKIADALGVAAQNLTGSNSVLISCPHCGELLRVTIEPMQSDQ